MDSPKMEVGPLCLGQEGLLLWPLLIQVLGESIPFCQEAEEAIGRWCRNRPACLYPQSPWLPLYTSNSQFTNKPDGT